MQELFGYRRGGAPLIISMPHAGSALPPDALAQMTPAAVLSADTDWHVEKLYAFAEAQDATLLWATQSRYLIDLNRDPDNRPLYPGASNTELCPTSTFDEEPLYPEGRAPDAEEIARRRAAYWQPYHDKLAEEIARLRADHPRIVLWEGHSIRSEVPRFFEGHLPDLNFGTADGASSDPALAGRLLSVAAAQDRFTHVLNGRFKGGYITRAYGKPAEGVHAVQLELGQSAYMEENPPFSWDEARAAPMMGLLEALIGTALAWSRESP